MAIGIGLRSEAPEQLVVREELLKYLTEEQIAEQGIIKSEAQQLQDKAALCKITDDASAEKAAAQLTVILKFQDQVTLFFDTVMRPLKTALDAVRQQRDEALAASKQAAQQLRDGLTAWTTMQKRLKAEQERIAAEAQRKANEEAQLAMAIAAEEAGTPKEVVEQILNTPVLAPVAPLAPVSRIKGATPRTYWHAEYDLVEDGKPITEAQALMKLVKAVAEGRAPLAAVCPDWTALNDQARSCKTTLAIPGIKAVGVEGISAKRR